MRRVVVHKDVELEVLVVPPEGAAHASNLSIDFGSCPASIATDETSKGRAKNSKSVPANLDSEVLFNNWNKS